MEVEIKFKIKKESEIEELPIENGSIIFSEDFNNIYVDYNSKRIIYNCQTPKKLKFTGAVTDEYDGSSEKIINIPTNTGSGEGSYNIGSGLKYEPSTNILSVDVSNEVSEGNFKPITSNAVYETIGNINEILEKI